MDSIKETGAQVSTQSMPSPNYNEHPTDYAYRLALWYSSIASNADGQIFTPPSVAKFMAQQIPMQEKPSISVLDPGIGTGILSCATIEEFVDRRRGGTVFLEGYDADSQVLEVAMAALNYAKQWAANLGVGVSFALHCEDFIFAGLAKMNGSLAADETGSVVNAYDTVIMNPPYFKINASDPRAKAVSRFAGKQTNIYTLFLSVASQLLSSDGVLISVQPRSFTSGMYFQAFRKNFFRQMQPIAIHLFDSRKEVFPHVDVLQETLILVTRTKSGESDSQVTITTSRGSADIDRVRRIKVRLSSILLTDSKYRLAIPTTKEDCQLLDFVHSWPNTLADLGLEVSTGPVVPFRATQFLVRDPSEAQNVVPLLWMHHVTSMKVKWPLNNHKPEYIRDISEDQHLLVKSERYILIRRFSTKEEQRRLVAAVMPETLMQTERIGIENHLNFIHQDMHGLDHNIAYGLAVLLNSSIMDMYFRVLNGSTQVNAYDLRQMPLPSRSKIEQIGERYLAQVDKQRASQDSVNMLGRHRRIKSTTYYGVL